jgi:hypothetical protein
VKALVIDSEPDAPAAASNAALLVEEVHLGALVAGVLDSDEGVAGAAEAVLTWLVARLCARLTGGLTGVDRGAAAAERQSASEPAVAAPAGPAAAQQPVTGGADPEVVGQMWRVLEAVRRECWGRALRPVEREIRGGAAGESAVSAHAGLLMRGSRQQGQQAGLLMRGRQRGEGCEAAWQRQAGAQRVLHAPKRRPMPCSAPAWRFVSWLPHTLLCPALTCSGALRGAVPARSQQHVVTESR